MKKPNSAVVSSIYLPTDVERDQIFYWLKRISSFTAWNRIFEYYSAWAAATESSVRTADENGWGSETSLPQSEYVLILKCLAHCEEGVRRLKSGDKRVFKFDCNGEFAMAARMLSHWLQMLERIRLGENAIAKNTPSWPEFHEALVSLGDAWGECGPYILEPRYIEDAAPVNYGPWLQSQLITMPFPDTLSKVPDPIENIFVRTGEVTPCSGIWEPVDLPKSSFFSLLTKAPKPQPPFKIIGTMNYLHASSNAPRAPIEYADDNIDVDTTWRLIWKDDRYLDGKIPEEESGYCFAKPDSVQPLRSPTVVAGDLVWGESGLPVPIGGKWLVEVDLNAYVQLQKGEKLPLHEGRVVRWVLSNS